MQISAISVCVNYSDFAAWSIMANKDLFSKWIIVTDTKDELTKQLCSYHGVQCIQTDIFYEDGSFKKFKGINEALKKVGNNEWVVFIDIDMVLPPHTKRVFSELEFDKKCIYGIDRVNCNGIQSWIKFVNNPRLIIDSWLLTPSGMNLGSRIIHLYGQRGDNGKFGGYKPLGFFQMCHTSQFSKYPDECKGADHCDIVFANLWSRSQRTLIPEILGVHLESEDNKWGSNWNGRLTAPFMYSISSAEIEVFKTIQNTKDEQNY